MAETRSGCCPCGSVAVEVTGPPLEMGYCHCEACRSYSGAPVSTFLLWKADAVKILRGEEFLGVYRSSEFSNRRFCMKCGGAVMTEHPAQGLTDFRPAVFCTLAFEPMVHLNYEETVLPMRDGLPKLKDFPAHAGGSGETLPE